MCNLLREQLTFASCRVSERDYSRCGIHSSFGQVHCFNYASQKENPEPRRFWSDDHEKKYECQGAQID